ncbi:MAG: hypothetical protein ACOYLX_19550 [Burkholderiaceae bacterium]
MWAIVAQVLARAAATPTMAAPIQSNPIISTGSDFSGWTVATSGSSARGGARTETTAAADHAASTDEALSLSTAGPGASLDVSPVLLLVGVVALLALRRKGI